jgi:hypothetical protein
MKFVPAADEPHLRHAAHGELDARADRAGIPAASDELDREPAPDRALLIQSAGRRP